jgi:hypothetical protein
LFHFPDKARRGYEIFTGEHHEAAMFYPLDAMRLGDYSARDRDSVPKVRLRGMPEPLVDYLKTVPEIAGDRFQPGGPAMLDQRLEYE